MNALHRLLIILVLLAGFCACNPEIDVLAPEKEAYVVYAVLNPQNDTQFVKIVSVFQMEGDVLFAATTNDFTSKGMIVTLSGGGNEGKAIEIENYPKEEGIFSTAQSVYAIPASVLKIKEGIVYTLHIQKPNDDNFLIEAKTQVPERPIIKGPIGPYILPHGTYTNPTVDFESDNSVTFKSVEAGGFEVRVYVSFEVDGIPRTVNWGPIKMFRNGEGCPGLSAEARGCYKIPGYAVPRFLKSFTDGISGTISYIDEPQFADNPARLSQAARIEVTAIDTILSRFLQSTSPGTFGINLLMDKKDYSNISGGNFGIFGSINTHSSIINLGTCTKYLGGLIGNGTLPAFCHW